jgi:dTDP-glucose 4,6-dehydratase
VNDLEKTVLVTGGAGFIGSHVVERLLRAACRVVNLDLLTYAGNLNNLVAVAHHPRYRFVHGDICDRRLMHALLAEHQPDVVLNIAAETHVDRSIDNAAAFVDTNIGGVFHLLDCSTDYWRALNGDRRGAFLFIQMSTDEVYGSIAEGMFTEDSNYAPNSPYAASKAAGDHMARAYRMTYGLPTVIVHASNTYGPRQYPEKLIPHMIISAVNKRQLPVYGQGNNVRDWLFVSDLADGLERVVVAGAPGEVYNFSGGNERTNLETVQMICSHLSRLTAAGYPYESQITLVQDRPGHDLRYAMSIEKVARTFGWKPRTRFEDGLSATIAWYLANIDWYRAVLARGYDGVRLGTRP